MTDDRPLTLFDFALILGARARLILSVTLAAVLAALVFVAARPAPMREATVRFWVEPKAREAVAAWLSSRTLAHRAGLDGAAVSVPDGASKDGTVTVSVRTSPRVSVVDAAGALAPALEALLDEHWQEQRRGAAEMLEALQGRRRAEREQERQERAATAGEARGRLARALAAVEQDLARLSPPASTAPEPDLAPEPAQTPELDLPPTGPSLSRELAPGIWIVGTPPASAEDRRERRAAELQRRRDAAEGRREQREAEMQRRREQRAADLEERRRQLNAALEAVGTAPVVSGPVTAPDDTARAIAELALELQRPKPVLVRVLDEPRLVAAAGNPYPKPLGAALLAGALGGAMVALFVEYCARESARRKVV